jgi:hypothetical protein
VGSSGAGRDPVVSVGLSAADRPLVISVGLNKVDLGLMALAGFSKADHHRLLLHSNVQPARPNLPRGENVVPVATEEPEAADRAINNLVASSICLVIVTSAVEVRSSIADRSPARRVSAARPKAID